MVLALIILVLIISLAAIPFALIYTRKLKEKAALEEKGIKSLDNDSTQSFLPYESIHNSVVELGNDEYCAYIKCNSINYSLKTEAEQEAFEQTFTRFIESISFPFAFYVQTREVDFEEILKDLYKDIQETMKNRPGIADYGQQFYQELSHLDLRFGSLKQKNKYIIITYKLPDDMSKLSKEERYEYALDEVYNRANLVCDQLAAAEIKAEVLKTNEIYDVVYQSLHKDKKSIIKDAKDQSFYSLVVDGKQRRVEQIPALYDRILLECIHRLNVEIASQDDYPAYKEISKEAIEFLDKLRDNGGAYYKDREGERNV